MPHQGYANINTGQKEYRDDVLITGFYPLAGSALNLSISGGSIDGRWVAADTSVAVTAGDSGSVYSGFLVSEDGSGSFVVTNGADTDHATEALAIAQAKALDVPTGDTALFVGTASTTTVGNLKDDSVKGRVLGDDIAADETITID
jgi:hypothetical protein